MSLRLKSHTEACPNGFLYTQSQTNWQSWVHAPNSKWDWNQLLMAVQSHRQSNPKLGLSTDLPTIEREMDYVNALRVSGMRGGKSYVVDDERPPPPKATSPRLMGKLASAAAGVKKVSAGAMTLLNWDLKANPPVDSEKALFRAETCVVCPLNGKGDWTRWFTRPMSERIRATIQESSGLKLTTQYDAELGVCEACLCPLKLKVWTPIDLIAANMSPTVMAELHPDCWVLRETT